MPGRKHSGKVPAGATRFSRRERFFEALESRLLLATDTWIGGATDNWNDHGNWSTDSVPAATDDVIFNNTADVTLNGVAGKDPTCKSLQINGSTTADVNVTFDPDLDLRELHVVGTITLNQTPGHAAGLQLASNNGPTNKTFTVFASGLSLSGDAAGWSNVVINSKAQMDLSHGNFESNGDVVNLTVNGSLNTYNAYIHGKTIVTLATATASNIVVNSGGQLEAQGDFRVGGVGLVNMTAGGGITVGNLELHNGTVSTVSGTGNLLAATSVTIGGADVGGSNGASLTVDTAGVFRSNGSVDISGGNGIQVTTSGEVTGWSITVGTGASSLSPGPLITVSDGGVLHGRTILTQGGWAPNRSSLLVKRGGNVAGDLFIKMLGKLEVQAGGTLGAPAVHLGHDIGGGSASGYVILGGAISGTFVDIGDHGLRGTYVSIATGGTITATTRITKHIAGYVGGPGATAGLVGPVTRSWGTGADFMPGDYLILSDGILSADPDASTAPFGTLTIDGDLDASIGTTLDSVFGDPGNSNKLYVTGTATISGDLDIYLTEGTDSTSYIAGDSFTLLTADGGLFGQFTNLPAGYYNNFFQPTLPALNSGLVWEIEYTGSSPADGDPANSVLLKVRQRPVIPTSEYATTDDITPSGSRINVGGGYADVTAAIYSTATVSMGALASGLAIAWNGDHSFGDYIDYYDSPTGGSSLELGGQFQVIVQYREAQPNYRFPTLHRVRLAA